MPVYPVEWVPVTMSGRYPQMAKNDMLVWERFLLIHGGEFEAAAYNVALGGVTPAGDELSEARPWFSTVAPLAMATTLLSVGVDPA